MASKAAAIETTTTEASTTVRELAVRPEWECVPEDGPCAEVQYGAGVTLEGEAKFEFVRFDIRVTMPCDPRGVAACLASVQRWTDRRLAELAARHRAKVAGEEAP